MRTCKTFKRITVTITLTAMLVTPSLVFAGKYRFRGQSNSRSRSSYARQNSSSSRSRSPQASVSRSARTTSQRNSSTRGNTSTLRTRVGSTRQLRTGILKQTTRSKSSRLSKPIGSRISSTPKLNPIRPGSIQVINPGKGLPTISKARPGSVLPSRGKPALRPDSKQLAPGMNLIDRTAKASDKSKIPGILGANSESASGTATTQGFFPTPEQVGEALEDAGEQVGGAIEDVAEQTGDIVDEVADTAGDVVEDVADNVADTTEQIGDAIGGPADGLGEQVADEIREGGDLANGRVDQLGEVVGWGVRESGELVGGTVEEAGNNVGDAVRDIPENLDGVRVDVNEGIDQFQEDFLGQDRNPPQQDGRPGDAEQENDREETPGQNPPANDSDINPGNGANPGNEDPLVEQPEQPPAQDEQPPMQDEEQPVLDEQDNVDEDYEDYEEHDQYEYEHGYLPPIVIDVLLPLPNRQPAGPVIVSETVALPAAPIEPAFAEKTEAPAPPLPQVPVGATLQLAGRDLGQKEGQVLVKIGLLTLPAEVKQWQETVIVTLPNFGLAEPTAAELQILRADGTLDTVVAVELIPSGMDAAGK